MRIKICGINRAQDARAAAQAGADFIGLNFYPASPRYVGADLAAEPTADPPVPRDPADDQPDTAAAILDAVETPAIAVAVTVNMTRSELNELIVPSPRVGRRPFGVVQLHGRETPALADYLIDRGVKVIKAFHAADADFAAAVNDWLGRVRQPAGLLAVLLDTPPPSPRQYGGSGQRFNWEWIADAREAGSLDGWPPLMLAGGLTPSNVAKAVRIVRPWGVDVASGVEIEDSPGRKSVDRVRNFIRNARVG